MVPTKTARKEILRLTQALKKAKGLDDPFLAKKAQIIALWDQWFIKQIKVIPALKAHLKKAEKIKKKEKTRLNKDCKKAQKKAQINNIWKLALVNSQIQINTFQDYLSDFL